MMIRGFLMAILMAGIFSAMARPLYLRFLRWFKGRRSLASFATLLVILLVIIIPLGALLGVVAAQAIEVGNSVSPWIQKQLSDPTGFVSILEKIPFYDQIATYQDEILQKVGQMVGSLSSFLISGLSSVTVLTVSFLFKFFVFLYTMYFFLIDGDRLSIRSSYYCRWKKKMNGACWASSLP